MGHLGLQYAVKMGLKTVGVDNRDATIGLAKKLDCGATIIDSRQCTPEQAIEQIGEGVDAAIILPEAQPAFDYGLKLTKKHGLINVVSFASTRLERSSSI